MVPVDIERGDVAALALEQERMSACRSLGIEDDFF
jgi:hypothetical protein